MSVNGEWATDQQRYERRCQYAANRRARLMAARGKGTHSEAEWDLMRGLFGCCVKCLAPFDSLLGGKATKDHIVPISEGGCDCLANLQPLCRECNSAGVGVDLREAALPGWQTKFISALETQRSR